MIIKVGDTEFTFDGYYNTSQTIRNLAEKCYQQGRVDAIDEFAERLHSALSNRGSANLHDIVKDVAEQLKEQTNE